MCGVPGGHTAPCSACRYSKMALLSGSEAADDGHVMQLSPAGNLRDSGVDTYVFLYKDVP